MTNNEKLSRGYVEDIERQLWAARRDHDEALQTIGARDRRILELERIVRDDTTRLEKQGRELEVTEDALKRSQALMDRTLEITERCVELIEHLVKPEGGVLFGDPDIKS